MYCEHCGAPLEEDANFCGQCGGRRQPSTPEPVTVQAPAYAPFPPPKAEKPKKEKKARKTPGRPVRIVLRVCSVALCLVLFCSVLLTALIADLRQLLNQENLTQVVAQSLAIGQSPSAGTTPSQWLYEVLDEGTGALGFTEEQLGEYLQSSSASSFVGQKVASFTYDLVYGTSNTDITVDEVMALIESDRALIEDIFDVRLSRSALKSIRADVHAFLVGQDFVGRIHAQVIKALRSMSLGGGYTLGNALDALQALLSARALLILLGICLALALCLLPTNWLRVYAALNWAGVTLLIGGGLLSVPVLILQLAPGLLSGMLGSLVSGVVSLLAPVHYTVFLLGLVLMLGAIVLKIFYQSRQT